MCKERKPKEEFINKTKLRLNHIEERFNLLQKKYSSGSINISKETQIKIQNLNSCIDKLKWRLDYFAKDDIPIDTFVENSFRDMQMEIEWRLTECQLAMEDKQITSENEKKRINKNYDIKRNR
jgi:hypothetical protein